MALISCLVAKEVYGCMKRSGYIVRIGQLIVNTQLGRLLMYERLSQIVVLIESICLREWIHILSEHNLANKQSTYDGIFLDPKRVNCSP